MKIVTKTLFGCFKSVFLLLVLSCVTASASAKNNPIAATTSIGTYTIKGAVKDAETKAPIVGASVLLEGTSKGALTDENGNFTLVLDDKDKKGTLVISFVGYETQKVVLNGQETLSIALEEGKNLEEVVVTGVLDARTRLEASTAISVLKTKDIERLAPQSAVDLLKNIPGVFVTSARGEIANTVYVRGLSDFPNFYGFYYVSMQEDGLPISAINNGVDFYLRADATVSKIEAVRGGSASILGPNAPGGIFNYISKTGGETFGGEAR